MQDASADVAASVGSACHSEHDAVSGVLAAMGSSRYVRRAPHLLAPQEIDVALSQNAFDKGATIAEQRLGMSSLELHGATHIAPFMPQGMQEIGTQMHRAASRFAVEAQTASVGNDVRPALAALGSRMRHQ